MGLRLIKFEKNDAWSTDAWAVINSTTDTMLRPVFFDELQALLWLAYAEKYVLKYDANKQENIASQLLVWLDEVAPRYHKPAGRFPNGVRFPAVTGDRIFPDAWAKALVDTSGWDEEAAQAVELREWELVERLWSRDAQPAIDYLFEQFGEWEPKKAGAQ